MEETTDLEITGLKELVAKLNLENKAQANKIRNQSEQSKNFAVVTQMERF